MSGGMGTRVTKEKNNKERRKNWVIRVVVEGTEGMDRQRRGKET